MAVGQCGGDRKAASQALGREKRIAERARRRELVLILIARIATVRVVIAMDATVQMEEADSSCRWEFKCMVWNGQTDQLIHSSIRQAPGPSD